MLIFVCALSANRLFTQAFERVEGVIYALVCLSALLWAILNYIAHFKLYAMCQRFSSIQAFTDSLLLEPSEKEELSLYLNDFVADLENMGKDHELAVQEAIRQFQVQEFTQKGALQTTPQYYLLGCGLVFSIISFVIQIVNLLVHLPFLILATSFMLLCFGVGLIGLFFIYRIVDVILRKQID